MNKRFSAYHIYLIFSGAMALFFSMVATVMIVYQMEKAHLNPLQLVLVGTTLETVCFIFEIPTGIVADLYSRKWSVVIGTIFIGCGFILEGSVPKFTALLAAQVISGIGFTFLSGALDAWIVGEEKNRDLEQIYLRGSQAGQIGSITGIGLAMIIANFALNLPMLISGGAFLALALFLILCMPELHFRAAAPQELTTFAKMGHTLKSSMNTIKGQSVLLLLLGVTLCYGLSSEGYDRLSQAHFLKDTTLPKLGNLQPVTWFGIFGIVGMLLSAMIMEFVIKRLQSSTRKNQNFAVLLLTNIGSMLSMSVFALSGNFSLMLPAYLATNMFRIINEPIYNAWLNRQINDDARATVLSTNGQLNALGQIVGGPVIGLLATRFSIGFGITCTALLFIPAIGLYVAAGHLDRDCEQ